MPRVALALARSFHLMKFPFSSIFAQSSPSFLTLVYAENLFEIYLSIFPFVGLYNTIFAMLFSGFGLSVCCKI